MLTFEMKAEQPDYDSFIDLHSESIESVAWLAYRYLYYSVVDTPGRLQKA